MRAFGAGMVLSTALGTALAVDAVADLCRYNFGNSSFDLSPLKINTYYKVDDSANNRYSTNYSYFINVCGNVDPATLPYTGNQNNCSYTYGGANVLTGPSPAFQVANWPVPFTDQCHRLGYTLNSTNIKYSLYDTTNPSRGVSITYMGGDQCAGGNGRSLKLWLLCDPDAYNIPDSELVQETGSCNYEIFVNSAFGCPAECPVTQDPVNGRSLCSNHGLCDFDAAIQNSRCFCNTGWEGRDCGTPAGSSGGLSATGAVLVAVGIFLAATLGVLVFLWLRIRGLRLDPTAYSALRAGPDDHADTSVQ